MSVLPEGADGVYLRLGEEGQHRGGIFWSVSGFRDGWKSLGQWSVCSSLMYVCVRVVHATIREGRGEVRRDDVAITSSRSSSRSMVDKRFGRALDKFTARGLSQSNLLARPRSHERWAPVMVVRMNGVATRCFVESVDRSRCWLTSMTLTACKRTIPIVTSIGLQAHPAALCIESAW